MAGRKKSVSSTSPNEVIEDVIIEVSDEMPDTEDVIVETVPEPIKVKEPVITITPDVQDIQEDKIVDAQVIEKKKCGVDNCTVKYGSIICKSCVDFKK